MKPIQLDRQYKTRDGREVKIHAIDRPNRLFPVFCSVKEGDDWRFECRTINGTCEMGLEFDSDLIEVVPIWEGEIWVKEGDVRRGNYYASHEEQIANNCGWRKIKVKQVEDPT